MSHTTEPWVAFDNRRPGEKVARWAVEAPSATKIGFPRGFGTRRICEVASFPDAGANARLIAAAPDLLNAAIHLRDCLARGLNMTLVLAQLEAAITKAVGKEE